MEQNIYDPADAGFWKIFDISPVGMVITREDFVITKANDALCNMLGYSDGEILQMTFKDFTHPEDLTFDLASYERLKKEEIPIYRTEKRYLRKDGQVIWGALSLIMLPETEGSRKYVLAVVQDITQRKKTESEILAMNEELRILNAEKDKLFSIIAHDLKSPFHSFINLAQRMEERFHDATPGENLEYIRKFGESSLNLFRLLENLLDWARLQRGMVAVRPVHVSMADAVANNLDLVKEPARKKEIGISFDIPENVLVYADERMVDGILRNLLTNAVKFTPRGGTVTVTAKQVMGTRVEVCVKDTGIGMSQKMAGELFRIDVGTGRPGTEGEPSSGLGLILCKEFAERNGGHIRVESEPGRGTAFTVTLPAP
jgi:PAS domain S-box-containing protein